MKKSLLNFLCDSEHTLVISLIPLVACRKYAAPLHMLTSPFERNMDDTHIDLKEGNPDKN